mmetsp:Transcript_81469/g.143877  ORF Transcript_81469/g.143877 Transcript_81469/m.143877 type:complete len:344 (-) Transcript_81469:368-1399(-)
MQKTQAYVSTEKGFTVESKEVERPACGPSDVVVKIIASGLCRSDLDMMTNSWGVSEYPLVAGHEGIGFIVEVGQRVKTRKVGQLVCLGWMRDSCQSCRLCNAGQENVCCEMQPLARSAFHTQQGTFAEYCVSPEKFAVPAPEGLDVAPAAPLICAGLTVYTPLATYTTHVSKVLIVSLGGLGGMAVQFASKMGCEVVVMNRKTIKKEQALRLGAHSYIDSESEDQLKASAGKFDLILDTTPKHADMRLIMPLLRANGRYVCVGLPSSGAVELHNFDLVPEAKGIAGSVCGSISHIEDMMIFAARHGIVADCETMPMSQLGKAAQILEKARTKRCVLFLCGRKT